MDVFKAIGGHVVKHGKKYAIFGGVVVGGVVIYKVGNSKGHTRGKIEGTVEQAARDKAKMQDMHRRHEQDRKKWDETDQEKNILINDLMEKLENQDELDNQ